ncbi:MAG: AAA family ATPase, partial [bacterium]|nr:AAA family ATPase [bacterium]
MSKNVYYEYNPWWEGEYSTEGMIERTSVLEKIEKWMKDERIIILTGLRRVGKTTIMKLLIRKLMDEGVEPGDIFYVSLDDYALESRSILDIVNEYRSIQKLPVERKVYLFL